MKYEDLEREIQILRSMSMAYWQLWTHLNKVSVRHGLTIEHCGVLGRLEHNDGCTQQDLADDSLKSKSAITRLIDNMEKRGLISRIHHPTDRRINSIYLTPKGIALYQKLKMEIIQEVQKIISDCPEKDIDMMINTLSMISERLTKNNY